MMLQKQKFNPLESGVSHGKSFDQSAAGQLRTTATTTGNAMPRQKSRMK
jgi:hypothetical protein